MLALFFLVLSLMANIIAATNSSAIASATTSITNATVTSIAPSITASSNSSITANITESMPEMTFTILPVPAPSDAFSPDDYDVAVRLGYQPIWGIDYVGQDLFPWRWVRDYEACLRRCESHNTRMQYKPLKEKVFCKAALFAPARVSGKNDCYLKKSLDNPQKANVTLIGGIKIEGNGTGFGNATSSFISIHLNSTHTLSSTLSRPSLNTTENTHTVPSADLSGPEPPRVPSKTTSSQSDNITGRPSISSTSTEPTASKTTPAETTSPSKPTAAGVSKATASELTLSNDVSTVVLTLPVTHHTHRV